MKNTFLFAIIIAGLLVSCSPKTKTDAEIKDQIFAYNEQIADIEMKISELEAQLKGDSIAHNSVKVKTLQIISQPFEHHFEATGNIEAVEEAFISPEMSGQIKNIYVKEGENVSKGKTLVALNSDVLRNNLASLKPNLELATTMYEKQKELWEQNIGSEVQYLQAKTQKESLETNVKTIESQIRMTTINAPFSGIVDKIFQKEGEFGTPGMRIIQLVNLDYMYATAQISEIYLATINNGDSVKITFPSYPDLKINSVIYQKGNVIDPDNRTFEIKIKFKNIGNKIKPNLLAVLTLSDYYNAKEISVPTLIINQDIKGSFVYVEVNKANKKIAEKRYVEIGLSNGYNTIIKSGLHENEKVIVEGYHLVKDGTVITE